MMGQVITIAVQLDSKEKNEGLDMKGQKYILNMYSDKHYLIIFVRVRNSQPQDKYSLHIALRAQYDIPMCTVLDTILLQRVQQVTRHTNNDTIIRSVGKHATFVLR